MLILFLEAAPDKKYFIRIFVVVTIQPFFREIIVTTVQNMQWRRQIRFWFVNI